MKPVNTIMLVACMFLQLGTVHADFEPTETTINGETVIESTCLSCSLTEVPNRECTTRSPECRVYVQSNVPPFLGVETLAFSVGDDDTVGMRMFFFWDVEHGRWIFVQNGYRDINITKNGYEWTVENTDPYPYYFSRGDSIPIFRADRFLFRLNENCGWGDNFCWPWLIPVNQGEFEIWAPLMD